MDGFVIVGRAELWFAFIAVAVLMATLGWALGQIAMIMRRPAPQPSRPCPKPHCDDFEQLGMWLGKRDFSIITNEQLAALRARPAAWPAGDPDAQ